MNGAWLSTKKRGRDDELIERDREIAKELRLRRKGLQPRPNKGKKHTASSLTKNRTTNTSTASKKKKSPLEGFLVDNDEEIDCQWSAEDSSEEEVRSERQKTTAPLSSSSDSEVSSPDTFMGKHKKRKSIPSKGLLARSKNQYSVKKLRPDVVSLRQSSSSEDEELKITPKRKDEKPRTTKVITTDNSSIDDSVSMDVNKSAKLLTKYNHEPDSDMSLLGRSRLSKRLGMTDNQDTSLLDTPLAYSVTKISAKMDEQQPSKTLPPVKQPITLFDSSDDEHSPQKLSRFTKMKAKKTIKTKKSVLEREDFCSDEDEAIAIAAAIEASRKDMEAKENMPSEEEELNEAEEIIVLQDSSDGEEDFVDEEARAASSVLDTANKLSALILKTMATWSTSAVEGMIVDGAISLGEAKGRDHTWISQETLKDIVPSDIKLAEYQLIGVNWMALLHGMKCEVEGNRTYANVNGILADEMGLGKTCQTITFLNWLKHSQRPGASARPHLIVAPASVLSNWFNEITRFAPKLKVIKFHGTAKERPQLQGTIRDLGKTGSLDIILVSVTCFQKEKSEDRSFLRNIDFDYLVVDEAHSLSNSKSIRYKSMDKLKTLHRLLLTGTPVQNSPKELMSLLCFLMPLFSRKGTKFDKDSNQDGGEGMLQHFVSMQKRDDDDHAAYGKLKQLFSPFVLRRRKADVLSQILPPKERKVEFVPMSKTARAVYDAIIAQHMKNKQSDTRIGPEHVFTQLRKAAHHPLLIRSRYTSESEKKHLTESFYKFGFFRGEGAKGCTKEKVHQELEKYNDFEIHLAALQLIEEKPFRQSELGRYVLYEDDLFGAEKCVKLRSMLPGLIADGHRVLLFSVWTSILDILGCLMEQMNIECRRMDGSSPVGERQNMIDEFNRDPSIKVFLLSTKACGLGINLTSADTCIVHDMDFNPFNDLQAEDRCHRIGQTKPVTIIKLVTLDTVDESIYNMQQRKAKMNAAIMGSAAEWKKVAEEEKKIVVEEAVQRYLKSPDSKNARAAKENEENKAASDEESF